MSQRAHRIVVLCLAVFALAGETASADNQPVVVIPGRPGVPVIINGTDATGAVVYGDWGLFRPGGAVFIEGGLWPLVALPPAPDWSPHYYPSTGRTPAYGRKEIDPGPRRPGIAPAYHRSWISESQPGPVTEYPPFAPPGVMVAPPWPNQQLRPPEHR
jgi:hypothetical protein